MKIEVIFVQPEELLNCKEFNHFSDTCYEMESHHKEELAKMPPFGLFGICIIDDVPIKFTFSPGGMDGKICTHNEKHRLLMKYHIPWAVYLKRKNLEKRN